MINKQHGKNWIDLKTQILGFLFYEHGPNNIALINLLGIQTI